MIKYPSIENLWPRDPVTKKLIFHEGFRKPEFYVPRMWTLQEKIDGMNIRVVLTRDEDGRESIDIKGRTDNAQLTAENLEAVRRSFSADAWAPIFAFFGSDKDGNQRPKFTTTIYGELYGPKIQKGGGNYGPRQDFRVFDVLYGHAGPGQVWATLDEIVEASYVTGLKVVPTFEAILSDELNDLRDARALRYLAPYSIVAAIENGDYDTDAEGVVARPEEVILDRNGNRVMWKLPFRDLE